jgi:transposase
MVDLERHSVIDILDDRSVESAAKWLRDHPSIEVVSRDRCGLYAQATREGAPQVRRSPIGFIWSRTFALPSKNR